MKKFIVQLGVFSMILLATVSCNNHDKELADRKVKELENYVDSLKTVTDEEMQANWDKIAVQYDQKTAEANTAIAKLKEDGRVKSQEQIDAASARYSELKDAVAAKQEAKKAKENPNQILRDRFFGAGKIGEDMNFAWVNKDNILNVYQNFFQAYKDNKSDFSREDYDEVKLMYEALDSRKNTVEKEGLTSEDNNKIAAIKFKFAPMFKVNRIGAKSRENAKAKE